MNRLRLSHSQTKAVVFEDRLLDVEFCPDDPTNRDQVDDFWSAVYRAGLKDDMGGSQLPSFAADIIGHCVYATDCHYEDGRVSVVIDSLVDLSLKNEEMLVAGPTVKVDLDTNGNLTTEHGAHLECPSEMRPHIINVLTQAALAGGSISDRLHKLITDETSRPR